jgi:hypothetical protein
MAENPVFLTAGAAAKVAQVTRIVLGDGDGSPSDAAPNGFTGQSRYLGRAASYIARGASGSVTIYHGSTVGSESSTGRTVTAYARYGSIAPGYDCEVYLLDGHLTVYQPEHRWYGQTDAAHNKGASGTVSIYSGATAGSETDTTNNLTGVFNYFGNVATTKKVHVRIIESGPGIIDAEC